MKRLMNLLTLVALGALLAPTADAKKKKKDADVWSKKAGVVGVGADGTLGGASGFAARYFLNDDLGLIGTFALGSDSLTMSKGGTDASTSEMNIDVGIYGEYNLLDLKQAALSGLVGVDITKWSSSTEVTGVDPVTADSSNISVGLGLKGEVFLKKYFSLYSKAGLSIDPAGDNDVQAAGMDPADYDASGMSISLGGGLWSSAGFTVWFD